MCSRFRCPPAGNGRCRMAEAASRAGRRDGKELFYFTPDSTLMAVSVDTKGGTFQPGVPKALFRAPVLGGTGGGAGSSWRWDISPDGKRFLINTALEDSAALPVTVVLNWQSALK